jgi:hypothetical protein
MNAVVAGRTTEDIAAAVGASSALIAQVLTSERIKGHLVCDADGAWRATPKLLAEYGAAFRALGPLVGGGP